MKILSISNPEEYPGQALDVPIFYQRLSQDTRVEFYHLSTTSVLDTNTSQVLARQAAFLSTRQDFLSLDCLKTNQIDLKEVNLTFCRTLKPFPCGYLDRLSHWEKWTKFVNSPSNKRKQIKSDFLLNVAKDYMPEAIVTSEWEKALDFFHKFNIIVAKKMNSTGGKGVFKIWYREKSFWIDNILTGIQSFLYFQDLMSYLQENKSEPIQFCRFLHKTSMGDKRVVVVDGEIYGGFIRRSKSGHWVNNISHDGGYTLADISQDEFNAIQDTVQHYQSLGLHTLGYDFLMDDEGTWRISEINAGNVTGFAQLECMTGKPMMKCFIDWLIGYAQRSQTLENMRSCHVDFR